MWDTNVSSVVELLYYIVIMKKSSCNLQLQRTLGFFSSTYVKFIYSEKSTQFWEIFTLLLSYLVPVKSKVKISQDFVAFSEYMNLKRVMKTE
jgi:hypothetical protein